MGSVHRLIEEMGKHGALRGNLDRRVVEAAAIRAIDNNSMAIDNYCWLAHYLPQLETIHRLPWSALRAQFGSRSHPGQTGRRCILRGSR